MWCLWKWRHGKFASLRAKQGFKILSKSSSHMIINWLDTSVKSNFGFWSTIKSNHRAQLKGKFSSFFSLAWEAFRVCFERVCFQTEAVLLFLQLLGLGACQRNTEPLFYSAIFSEGFSIISISHTHVLLQMWCICWSAWKWNHISINFNYFKEPKLMSCEMCPWLRKNKCTMKIIGVS